MIPNSPDEHMVREVSSGLDCAESHANPLTYHTSRMEEPTPPTWQELLDDLARSNSTDPIFKRTSLALPTVVHQSKDPVDLAHISLEVQVAARSLTALKDIVQKKCQSFRQSLEIFKEDIEDEDST